jgi:hypothetical protein
VPQCPSIYRPSGQVKLLMRTLPRWICTSYALDLADHAGRNRPPLPHTTLKWAILWCIGKLMTEAFFWICSRSRRFIDHPVRPWQGAASTVLGLNGLCIVSAIKPMVWVPPWLPPTLASSFLGTNLVAATTLGFGFCLVLVFQRETDIIYCNCDVESFCCESRPRSFSTPLWRLVLFCLEVEPHIRLRIIYICNFRLRTYPFLLVFFNSVAGKSLFGEDNRVVLGW